MKLGDLVAIAWGAVSRQRLRTGLSLLGVAIGVCAVVVLTALGEGARIYVRRQFDALGSNLLVIIPGKNETTGSIPGVGGAPNDITLGDAEALRRALPSAISLVPIAVGNESVANGDRRRAVVIMGASDELLAARKLTISSGSFLPALDWDRAAPLCVLGYQLARELFPGESALGKIVRIGDARTRVIGVLESRGTQLGMNMDDIAIVPVASAMRLFNRSSLFRVLITMRSPEELEAAERTALAIMTERHGEEDVTCVTQDSVSGALMAILAVLTLAVTGIAAISLSVAGIGIMNVMLVSVSERTSEVGLLRALGARRRQILALFVIEAVILASAGGATGLATSWGLIRLLAVWYPNFPAEPPLWAVAAAILVSIAVGVVFGVLPARRASALDPVRALSGR